MTVYATLVNTELRDKILGSGFDSVDDEEKNELMKEISFEAPDYIIGVGVISLIDNYISENNLSKYEMMSYSEDR